MNNVLEQYRPDINRDAQEIYVNPMKVYAEIEEITE